MKCLNCYNWATAEMKRTITVTINGKKYNLYVCNVCGNEAYIYAERDN